MKRNKKKKRVIKKKVKKIAKKAKKILRLKKRYSKVFKNSKIKSAEKVIVRQEFQAENLFRARIKVVGIGGGGGSIVSEIGKSLKKATFVIADTDMRTVKRKSGIKYFLFGQKITRGLGTGANPELAKQSALDEQEKIKGLFKDQDIVILIASLGGGVGSGATEIFAKMASSFGAITLGIFTLPFKFEGKNKSKIAIKSLKDLREILNVSITIPNEKIFKIISQDTPITQAFSVVNKNLINSLESLIDLIYNPGLINIDFADLRTILRGRGSLAFLNTIEEAGKNRAEQISKKILFNPLYQNNNFVPEKILFNISGPSNLSMFEVEKISNGISHINTKAKIIFGISRNQSSTSRTKNRIRTTLLMTGFSKKDVKLEKKEPAKIIPAKIQKKKNIIAPALPAPIQEKSPEMSLIDKKLSIVQVPDKPAKKAIRRSALDVRKEQEQQGQKRLDQEQEWEIPAFLRRVKFKS